MKARRLTGLAAALVLIALANPAFAQEEGVTIEEVDVRSAPTVSVTVSVPRRLVGQEAPDFVLTEDGVEQAVSVQAAAADDLKVVLLVDVSGSMRGEPLSAAKEAVGSFIEQMPAGVEMAVVAFGDRPSLAAEFTDNKQTLLAAVDQLSARGETALYDGLFTAASLLRTEAEEGRTILLVSDGGDTVSVNSEEETQSVLATLGAAFYAIELQSPENDSEALQRLANAAGGTVTAADEPDVLEALFGDIAAQLLNRYELTYTSAAAGSTSLRVSMIAQGVTATSVAQLIELPQEAPPIVPDPPPVVPDEPVGAVDPPPSLRPGISIELGWLQTRSAAWLAFGALFLALTSLFVVIALRPKSNRQGKSTLFDDIPRRATQKKKSTLAGIADLATGFAEKELQRHDRLRSVNAALERAGMAVRPGEFLVLVASIMLAVGALGLILLTPVLGAVLALVVLFLVPLWLTSKGDKRSALFGEQLGDNLQLMSASLRAGHGLLQAIDAVAQEAPSPSSEEFQRIKVETHLGRDLGDSLKATAERVKSEDFRWVAEAIEIHREIGGDLAQILDAVNETIRDRNKIRRRIKSLSAEGRISAVMLSLIPIFLIIVIMLINPSYIGELTVSGLGQGLIVGGVFAWFLGVVWMKKIIRLDF
jgi:tight adherence protein B